MDKQGAVLEGWASTLKDKFYELLEKLNLSQESATNMALYGGIGFLSGFVCKKSSSYVLVALLVILGIALLHQYNVLTIIVNWDEMSALLGIQQAEMTGDHFMAFIWGAIKANSAISVSYAIGFLLGLKLR